jgi:hypothetical protein
MVCVVILLAALGTVGYLLYRSHSGQMEAEAKRLAAEKQLEEEKARATAAEAAKAKQERENRLAIAQSLRDSFAGRAGVVTNNLHGLLERIPQVERELTDFRKGTAGVPVTQFPDLVEACSTFLSAKLNVPKRSIGKATLDKLQQAAQELGVPIWEIISDEATVKTLAGRSAMGGKSCGERLAAYAVDAGFCGYAGWAVVPGMAAKSSIQACRS